MKKFYKGVCKLERVLCTICLCSCTISLFVGAVMRTLDLPLNYTTDIALFSFAWCIFLGVGAAYREDKLVYVNVMIDRVPQKWRRAINAVTYLVIAVFLAVMVLYGIQLCKASWARSWPSIPSLSYSWITMSVPVGCLSLFVTTLTKFYDRILKGKDVSSDYISEL